MTIIITSPSLDEKINVSGISSVTKFIISNNKENHYIHFELGKKDNDKGGIYRILSILKNLISWIYLLKKEKDSIIHYNFPLSKLSIIRDPLFIFIAKLFSKKIIIHIHGGIFLTNPKVPFLLNYILKKIFSLNVPFIVLSELEKDIIVQRYNTNRIIVLPNCVDLTNAKNFQKSFNNDKPLNIGYLGRIAETKGMNELLEATIKLQNRRIPFILHLAGKEEIKDQFLPQFSNSLKNKFIYHGVISGSVKSSFIKNLDLFILPSYFEGLPMSLLECMSYGIVPITTNVGSIGEIIKDNNNGFFIAKKSSDSIVDLIISINKNRAFLNQLSYNAQNIIFTKFNPTHYIEVLNKAYSLLK